MAILGATGMIGSGIYNALKDSCSLVITYRNPEKLAMLYQRYGESADCKAIRVDFSDWYTDYQTNFAGLTFSPKIDSFRQELSSCNRVINAMGVTKAIATTDPVNTLFINGAVPHILASIFGNQLIHITTDCVFDGTVGAPYNENSPKRPVDLYGLSKSIGEPATALVLRTSTIGPELGTSHGLLDWFVNQTGMANGFTNHWWNGITTYELSRVCLKLVTGAVEHPGAGVYHIFSDDVTKHDLLGKLKIRYGLSTNIEPYAAPVGIDRRLTSQRSFCERLNLPALDQMIADLPEVEVAQLQTK